MDATVSCWNSSIAPGIPHILETTEGFLCMNGAFHHSVRHTHFVRNSSCLEFYARHLRHLCLVAVQSLSHVRLFATLWTTACQASLSVTNSHSLLKVMSIESVMPSNHLILCHPLLLLPSIFPSIRVFSNESAFHIR